MSSLPTRIHGHVVEPASQQAGGHLFEEESSGSDYIIIQCHDFLSITQRQSLEDLHVTLLDSPAPNTYLCQYKPGDLGCIRRLPFIIYANVYHPELAIEASLRAKTTTAEPHTLYDVQILPHKSQHIDLEMLRKKITQHLSSTSDPIEVSLYSLKARLTKEQIVRVARIDEVQAIHLSPSEILHSVYACKDIHSYEMYPPPALGEHYGKNETVAIHDTGIQEDHPIFKGKNIEIQSLNNTGGHTDFMGHGTAVAACAAGIVVEDKFQKTVMGSARNANLLIFAQDLHPFLPNQDFKTAEAMTESTNRQVGVLNCSYGAKWEPPRNPPDYGVDAYKVDSYAWDNGLLIVKSAGNDGSKKKEVRQPGQEELSGEISGRALAKNVITVGSCLSSRGARDPDKWSSSSSTGPCNNTKRQMKDSNGATMTDSNGNPLVSRGRTKPDVVAPGSFIYTARSSASDQTPLPGIEPEHQDLRYKYMSGTSFAAPFVAGCCATIISELKKTGVKLPQKLNVLVKAILINGAKPLPQDPNYTVPKTPTSDVYGMGQSSDWSGFGRVNVSKSLIALRDDLEGCGYWTLEDSKYAIKFGPPKQGFNVFYDYDKPIGQSEEGIPIIIETPVVWTSPKYKGYIPYKNFTVTMCFTDKASASNPNLIDCYILNLISADGKLSWRDDSVGEDGLCDNNVQRIIVKDIKPGTYFIYVQAVRVTPIASAQGIPPMAIAWFTEETGPPGSIQYANWNERMPSAYARRHVEAFEAQQLAQQTNAPTPP